MAYTVIDISKYQGDVDFASVKSQVYGVVVRAGYRGYGSAGTIVQDPYAVAYINACIAEGIPYGVYFFSQAINATEGAAEGTWVLNFLQQFTTQPLLPVYIDTEASGASGGRADSITVSARTAAVAAFCNTVEAAGYYAGIYASTSWFNSKLTDSALTAWTHWVAHYGVSAPTYTGSYDMWQYTSSGSITGISGRVDMNYAYIDFAAVTQANGLNGYTVGGTVTPTQPTENDDPAYVQSYACYLKYGYASGGDLATFRNKLTELAITYTQDSGYIYTDIKVSVGDQITLKTLANSLSVPLVEYIPEEGEVEVDPGDDPNPIIYPDTESWVVKLIKFLLDLFSCKTAESGEEEEEEEE